VIVDRKTGTVVTGTTMTKVVGQKMEFEVRTDPPGEGMSNIQWTIPAEAVKNYTQSTAAGTRTNLAAGDLSGATVDFYWIDRGSKTVQVAATVRGASQSASVTVNVLVPTDVTMTSVTGTVAVSNPGFPGSGLELHFGTNATPGITWTFSAKAPAGGSGEIAGTQLDAPTHQRTLNSGVVQKRNPAGAMLLDTNVPYAASVPIAAGAAATWTSSDTPGLPLSATLQSVTGRARFETYFMYKPAGADSIWVTIGRLDWSWTGTTARAGAPASPANNWGAPTATSPAAGANPAGAPSTQLPTWTDNVTSLTWI
jgi:hypothetical protein